MLNTQPNKTAYINIGLLILANILTFVVFWLIQINLSWLAYQLTSSALRLGFLGFFLNLPILMAIPIGGIFSDRFHRKYILLSSQILYIVPNLILFFLVITHSIGYWNMILTGILYGALFGIARPANDAAIYDASTNDNQLRIAISINASASQIAMLFTPYISKVSIATFTFPSIFIVCLIANILAFFAFFALRIKKHKMAPIDQKANLSDSLLNGLRYTFNNKTLLIFIVAISMALGVVIALQFQFPTIIKTLYHGTKANLYNFYYFSALGGLVGAILVILTLKKHGLQTLFKILVGALILQAAFLITLPLIPNIHWVYLIIFLEDLCGIVATIVGTISIQNIIADNMRGRVLSVVAFARIGSIPIISFILGLISSLASIYYGIILFAVIYLIFILVSCYYLRSQLKYWKPDQ